MMPLRVARYSPTSTVLALLGMVSEARWLSRLFCSNQYRYLTEKQKAKEDELFGPFAGNDGRTCQKFEYKFKYLHVDLYLDCKSSFVSSTSSHPIKGVKECMYVCE